MDLGIAVFCAMVPVVDAKTSTAELPFLCCGMRPFLLEVASEGGMVAPVAMQYLCTLYTKPLMMPKVMKRRMSMLARALLFSVYHSRTLWPCFRAAKSETMSTPSRGLVGGCQGPKGLEVGGNRSQVCVTAEVGGCNDRQVVLRWLDREFCIWGEGHVDVSGTFTLHFWVGGDGVGEIGRGGIDGREGEDVEEE